MVKYFPWEEQEKGAGCYYAEYGINLSVLMGFIQAIILLKNILCELHSVPNRAFYAMCLDLHF